VHEHPLWLGKSSRYLTSRLGKYMHSANERKIYYSIYHDYHHIQGDVIYAITILKSTVVCQEVETSWFYAHNLIMSLA
jgi:hypothetical protein